MPGCRRVSNMWRLSCSDAGKGHISIVDKTPVDDCGWLCGVTLITILWIIRITIHHGRSYLPEGFEFSGWRILKGTSVGAQILYLFWGVAIADGESLISLQDVFWIEVDDQLNAWVERLSCDSWGWSENSQETMCFLPEVWFFEASLPIFHPFSAHSGDTPRIQYAQFTRTEAGACAVHIWGAKMCGSFDNPLGRLFET